MLVKSKINKRFSLIKRNFKLIKAGIIKLILKIINFLKIDLLNWRKIKIMNKFALKVINNNRLLSRMLFRLVVYILFPFKDSLI